jgi:Tol biopolymer transport system component
VQFSARLSPDGRRVAYLDGGYLWVSAGAGKPVRLAELVGVSGPCWSADGKHLAYMRQDGPKRYLERIPSSGGEAKRLTEAVGSTCAWSPDGKWIAQLGAQLRFTDASSGTTNAVEGYQARGGAFNEKGELYAATRDAVSVLEVPSGREIVRTRAPLLASSSGTVAVHPSGRRIAYSEGTYGYDLWTMDMPQPTTGVRHFWRKWTLPAKPVASEAVLE